MIVECCLKVKVVTVIQRHLPLQSITYWGSSCGAVGRAIASNTRGPGFESSHWQLLLNNYLLLTVCRKDENKEKKRPGMAHLKKVLTYFMEGTVSCSTWKCRANYCKSG